jgi:large subunit ribosomal protein L17
MQDSNSDATPAIAARCCAAWSRPLSWKTAWRPPWPRPVRPHVEKMITLGKKGDVHSRRQALSFLMTDKAVERLFDTVAPRYGDRQGGYLRIVRTGFQKGDGAEKAFIELLGAEKQLDEKRQKRADVKAKKRAELEKQLEESKKDEEKGGEEAA